MNIRKTINKLQSALIAKGYTYKINTFQFYSEQKNRMITGYRITQKHPYRKENWEMSEKDVELLNSCSQVEVLKWFVGEWENVRKREMKIKPCKHCGVMPVVERLSGDRSFSVRCNNPDRGDICDQKFYDTISNSVEEAIKKWNEIN